MATSDAPNVPSHRGLLAVVIILGVLILLGVVGLMVGAVLKAGNRAPADASYAATVVAPGEHVESTELDGSRILLRLSGPNGEELVVLDAGSGRVLGRIAINAKP
ncbi:MAG TPA: hypothetical protein VGM72_04220 [Micropepsaceae bacterium]|jgi:hypothetical protein